MAAFSDTSFSTSAFSVSAFSFAVVSVSAEQNSGGYPSRGTLHISNREKITLAGLTTFHPGREPVFADYGTALERLRLQEPDAAEIIADVAARQAEDRRFDEQQRLEELQGEMRLRGIEMRSEHLAALNAERERRIDAEIGARMKLLAENENATLLLMMASSV